MRPARSAIKSVFRTVFELAQHFGIDFLPSHFYSSIPNIRTLKRDTHWRQPFDMVGVAGVELSRQIAFLKSICPASLIAEWPALEIYGTADREQGENGGYGIVEAHILHAFVRHHRPRRIVQIGCGLSTSVMLRAASLANYKPELICVEPYPSPFLLRAHESGRIKLIINRAEIVSRHILTNLDRGDMLFVDSTHSVKPGSEVNRIILDILPRLSPDVFVHFHDVHFPYDYQRGLLSTELFFSSESTLLHAFLINNARCQIVLSLSMLHYWAPQQIKNLIPIYDPQGNSDGLASGGGSHFPSATYMLMTEHA